MTAIKNFVSTFLTGLRELVGFLIIPISFVSSFLLAYYFNIENIFIGIMLIVFSIYGIYCIGKIKKESGLWK